MSAGDWFGLISWVAWIVPRLPLHRRLRIAFLKRRTTVLFVLVAIARLLVLIAVVRLLVVAAVAGLLVLIALVRLLVLAAVVRLLALVVVAGLLVLVAIARILVLVTRLLALGIIGASLLVVVFVEATGLVATATRHALSIACRFVRSEAIAYNVVGLVLLLGFLDGPGLLHITLLQETPTIVVFRTMIQQVDITYFRVLELSPQPPRDWSSLLGRSLTRGACGGERWGEEGEKERDINE